MRIALLGTRGVPAAYSGFETAVENLGERLAARGHEVYVYCRPHMVEGRYSTYKGMRLIYLPTIPSKHLDTVVHTLLSTIHLASKVRPHVAFYFIAGNAPFAGLSRLAGIPSIINVDGLDSRRAKWSRPAKRYIAWAEHNSARFANCVITDSRVLQRIYADEHNAVTEYIPYGADAAGDRVSDGDVLRRWELHRRSYLLFAGRLVPENNAHVLVNAFAGLETDLKLVVVGDAPYADQYQNELRASAARDSRVVLTGYVFGAGYRALLENAMIVVVPTEVGGTHPVLIEAMAAGNCIVVNDHEPNLEVLGDAGVSYDGASGAAALRNALVSLLADPVRVEALRIAAASRAHDLYSWDAVTAAYERLAQRIIRQ